MRNLAILALLLVLPLGAYAVGTADGTVPVGTTTTSSMMGVYGGVSLGTSYTGTAAPTNGAIVQGNVGIATTSPANSLDVYSGGIHIASNAPSSTANALYASGTTLYFSGGSLSSNSLWTTGSVGIGTSTAGAAGSLNIGVTGQSGFYGVIVGSTATGSPFKVMAQASDHLYLGANGTVEMMWRGSGSGTTGWLGVNYASISTTVPAAPIDVNGNGEATSYVTSSDIRWKKDIRPLEGALEKLRRLQGVSFFWRKDEYPDRVFDDRRKIGLIAQEAEKTVPELVSTGPDGFKSVEYEKFSALLINALKELKDLVDGVGAAPNEVAARVADRERLLDRQAEEIKELAALFESERRAFDEYKITHP